MPVELVIFDCDGVLVDSESISVRVGLAALRRLGRTMTESEYIEKFVGATSGTWEQEIGSAPPGWRDQFRAEYRAAIHNELRAVEGITDVLERLTIPFCVASNARHPTIRRNLRLAGLAHHFDGRIFSVEDVAAGKPAPDLFLHAAATMGAEPDACVVVEDSPIGVTAAIRAGMRCFAYAGGLTPIARLEELGATLFRHPSELPDLIGALT
ncbi:HAD family hydrolase [Nonomuraea sp. NPDC049309]|uniref:HAD family hydrolase n=1 Tax=Nonomuraea sp. NPDC049309 TaxID=3364350 RepID=UPI0037138DAD